MRPLLSRPRTAFVLELFCRLYCTFEVLLHCETRCCMSLVHPTSHYITRCLGSYKSYNLNFFSVNCSSTVKLAHYQCCSHASAQSNAAAMPSHVCTITPFPVGMGALSDTAPRGTSVLERLCSATDEGRWWVDASVCNRRGVQWRSSHGGMRPRRTGAMCWAGSHSAWVCWATLHRLAAAERASWSVCAALLTWVEGGLMRASATGEVCSGAHSTVACAPDGLVRRAGPVPTRHGCAGRHCSAR